MPIATERSGPLIRRPCLRTWALSRLGMKLPGICATGNGQAAVGLAPYFKTVIATDASRNQLDVVVPDDKVQYRVATAENSGIPDRSVNLVTVAQALHWFNLTAFYDEVSASAHQGGSSPPGATNCTQSARRSMRLSIGSTPRSSARTGLRSVGSSRKGIRISRFRSR